MTLDTIYISYYEFFEATEERVKHHLFSIKVRDLESLMDLPILEGSMFLDCLRRGFFEMVGLISVIFLINKNLFCK
ncbi:MAG: hypothetical protein ACJAUH_002236 [Saprospiraceae bacterium]|jgi:hypothetical protein